MKRYEIVIDMGIKDTATNTLYVRAEYSNQDLWNTVHWLNERAAGYPRYTPPAVKTPESAYEEQR